MNCAEFERMWNTRLDLCGPAAPELEEALRAHAAECAGCRKLGNRFAVLDQALQSWGPPPSPTADATERMIRACEAAWRVQRTDAVRWDGIVRWAAAAAILFGSAIALWAVRTRNHAPVPARVAAEASRARPLAAAVADASAATWDLARETSAPAARIGREVVSSSAFAQTGTLALPVPALPAVLPAVGDEVQRGVDPLSGSARHAFGFLLGPALSREARPPSRERET
jgi:hypothetical protein